MLKTRTRTFNVIRPQAIKYNVKYSAKIICGITHNIKRPKL